LSQNLTIKIADSPTIAGLLFRILDPENDFPNMSRIYNLAALIDNPQFIPQSPEALAQEFLLKNPDQRRNLMIVEINGEMVGWGSCEAYRQRENLYIGTHDFFLLPEWRHQGIELAAIGYFETRVSELLCDCPAEQAIYKIFVNDTHTDRIALLQSANYTQIAAHANMVRPDLDHIPDNALPEGIEIRPVADEYIRAIYETYREAFKEHIHGSDPSDEDFLEWSNFDDLSDRSLWVIAWDVQTDKVAGVILNFILEDENAFFKRKRGYVEFISVLQPFRRRGLARAMIAASLRQYKKRGMQEAALSSHTENPFNPISLYLEMGFQVRYHTLVFSKPVLDQLHST
jgi:mycothiol synthase